MDIFHLHDKCQHKGNAAVGRLFLASTHSHLGIFYEISRKPHRTTAVLGRGFGTFGRSETHSDSGKTGPWWIETLFLSTSPGRRSWLSALLLKNIDSSFWRLMEESIGFFFFSSEKLQGTSLLWVGIWAE